MRGWDEFSEFLLENRVPISADFNTYPIRIFYISTYKHINKYMILTNPAWFIFLTYMFDKKVMIEEEDLFCILAQ